MTAADEVGGGVVVDVVDVPDVAAAAGVSGVVDAPGAAAAVVAAAVDALDGVGGVDAGDAADDAAGAGDACVASQRSPSPAYRETRAGASDWASHSTCAWAYAWVPGRRTT